MDSNSEDIMAIAQDIKRYLNGHPHAADTVEGVIQWLASQKYEDTLERVNKALEVLVNDGVVLKTIQKDGTVLFERGDKMR